MSFGQFFWASSSWLFEIPQLGRPPGGGKDKKAPIGRIPRGRGKSWPWTGLRMAAKLFDIEMQITCTNVQKTNSYVCKLLSPCHGQKKTCGVGGHPTRSGVNNNTKIVPGDKNAKDYSRQHCSSRSKHPAVLKFPRGPTHPPNTCSDPCSDSIAPSSPKDTDEQQNTLQIQPECALKSLDSGASHRMRQLRYPSLRRIEGLVQSGSASESHSGLQTL